eukprot:547203_1
MSLKTESLASNDLLANSTQFISLSTTYTKHIVETFKSCNENKIFHTSNTKNGMFNFAVEMTSIKEFNIYCNLLSLPSNIQTIEILFTFQMGWPRYPNTFTLSRKRTVCKLVTINRTTKKKCNRCNNVTIVQSQRRDLSKRSMIYMDINFHPTYNTNDLWTIFTSSDTNGYVNEYMVQLVGFYAPPIELVPTKWSTAHYKMMTKVKNTIFQFETLTKTVVPIQFEIKPHNVSLLLMSKIKSKRKTYEPSCIDIPLFANDDEIIYAYCKYFQLNPYVLGIKTKVENMRKKLLHKSTKYYKNIFDNQL